MKNDYLVIVLIIMAALVALFMFPLGIKQKSSSVLCTIGQEPEEEETITMPRIKNVGGPRGMPGGIDEGAGDTLYILLRRNVPIIAGTTDPNKPWPGYPTYMGTSVPNVLWDVFSDPRHTWKYEDAGIPGTDVYYPMESGELDAPRQITDRNGNSTKELTLRTEGFLIFVHLDKDKKPIQILLGQDIYWMTDIYEDLSMYQDPNKGYDSDELFKCWKSASQQPLYERKGLDTESKTNKELQMGWFVFRRTYEGFATHCKPAIYLYPPVKTEVNVKVNTKGELTYTDPIYPVGTGWNTTAHPNGDLVYEGGRKLDYLYYESKIPDKLIEVPQQGLVVPYNNLQDTYNTLLPKLGLNQKETNQFIEYWSKALPYSPYYFLGFIPQQTLDEIEPLEVTPKPDKNIRVRIYFKALDQKQSIDLPTLPTKEKLTREGFTLTEWGGMVKLHPGTEYTCSQ